MSFSVEYNFGMFVIGHIIQHMKLSVSNSFVKICSDVVNCCPVGGGLLFLRMYVCFYEQGM